MMSKDLPLISVIVPIYNVSAYLKICLDSILGQSYTHLDVILIDDGSTDESGRIADEYACLDGRIRVVHQKNQGLSVARNVGLSLAQGEYISFVDSDDWLELDMYSELIHVAMSKPEIDIFKFHPIKKAKHLRSRGQGKLIYYEGSEVLKAYLAGRLSAVVWSGLYRADLAKSLAFVAGYYCEDVHYTLSLFSLNNIKVGLVDKRYYHYRVGRPGSTMSKGTRLLTDLLHLWYLLLNSKSYPQEIELLLKSCYIRTLCTHEIIMLREIDRGVLNDETLPARQEALLEGWKYAQEHILPLDIGLNDDFQTWLYLKYPLIYWLSKRPMLYLKYRKHLVHN